MTNNFSVSEDRDVGDMKRLSTEEERKDDYLTDELFISYVLLMLVMIMMFKDDMATMMITHR